MAKRPLSNEELLISLTSSQVSEVMHWLEVIGCDFLHNAHTARESNRIHPAPMFLRQVQYNKDAHSATRYLISQAELIRRRKLRRESRAASDS